MALSRLQVQFAGNHQYVLELQITQMAPAQRTAGIAAADFVFILAASVFFFCGHQFGLQRNGQTVRFPGEMTNY